MRLLITVFVLLIVKSAIAHDEKIDREDKLILAIQKEHSCYHISQSISVLIDMTQMLKKGSEEDRAVTPQYLEAAETYSIIYNNYCK